MRKIKHRVQVILRSLLLLGLILSGPSCIKYVDAPHQYNLGDKVLLKTGDTAVITAILRHRVTEDFNPTHQKYMVRVAYVKKAHYDSWSGHTESDVGTFYVYEYEIDKRIE